MNKIGISFFKILNIASIIGAMFLFACEKPELDRNSALTPSTDFDGVFDSFEVKASIRISNPVDVSGFGKAFFGVMNEAQFGKTKVDFVTEVQLNEEGFRFQEFDTITTADTVILRRIVPVFDSAALFMAYDLVIDTQTQPISVAVKQLTESLNAGIDYSSDYNYRTGSIIGFQRNVIFNDHKIKLEAVEDSLPAGMRIPLSSAFGRTFMEDILADTSITASQSAFRNRFAGIFVEAASQEGDGLLTFDNFLQNHIQIYFHYTTEAGTPVKSDVLTFPIDSRSTQSYKFENDYTGSAVELATRKVDLEQTFVSGFAGVHTVLDLSDLLNKDLSNQVVLEAELLLTEIPGLIDSNVFESPTGLNIGQIDAGNQISNLRDQNAPAVILDGTQRDGELKGEVVHQYKFNIPLHVQEIILGDSAASNVVIFVPNSNINPRRVVLGGNTNAEYGAKLKVGFALLEE